MRLTYRIPVVLIVSALFVLDGNGQTDVSRISAADKYSISAKAGGANLVVGHVTIARKDGTDLSLMKGDVVEVGERVTTSAGSRIELLLNPGSYVRIGPNSSFEFVSTNLDELELRLHSGSAMFEVFTTRDFLVRLSAGTAQFGLVETGVYRLDVDSENSARLSVWDGRAEAGVSGNFKARDGRRIVFANGTYSIQKFDRDDQDELAVWSRERGKTLAKSVASLQRDRMRDSLVSGFRSGRWNLYNTFGLWVYDPFFGSYCFLPFGYDWRSPYGYWFARSIWYFNLPHWVYKQPPPPSFQGRGPVVTTAGSPSKGDAAANNADTKVRRGASDPRVFEPSRAIPREPVRSEPPFEPVRPVITIPRPTEKKPEN